MSGLVRLYPRSWRDRYEAEFESLLVERPPRLRDRLDIVAGALDARLDPQLRSARPTRGPRLGVDWAAGVLAIAGGSLVTFWAAVVAAFARPWGTGMWLGGDLERVTWLSAVLGVLVMTGALLALLARDADRLDDTGRLGGGLAVAGVMLTASGLLGVVLLTVGIVLLARSSAGRTMPTTIALLLVAATLAFVAGSLAFVAGGGQDTRWLVLGIGLGPSWVVLGVDALRGRYTPAGGSVEAPPPATP